MSAKRKPDCFIDLWSHINQLETLLEVMNTELCGEIQDIPKEFKPALNRLHNLLAAAETVSDVLAGKCGVR